MTFERGAEKRTAFVLAGGGSLGAVQVGMLKALVGSGVRPDFIVGASVGAINGAYFAGRPDAAGIEALADIWKGLSGGAVFQRSLLKVVARLLLRHDNLLEPTALRKLFQDFLPYALLEEARIPCHIIATDIMSGEEVVFSEGAAATALLASTAVPAIFPPVAHDGRYLVDGGVANNTPISTAIDLGATRVIVLPTGCSCALKAPPRGAIPIAIQVVSLITMRQLAKEMESLNNGATVIAVPPLCPLAVAPFDFSHSAELIARAAEATLDWLEAGGLRDTSTPATLNPHRCL